jgi:hypothetical protein
MDQLQQLRTVDQTPVYDAVGRRHRKDHLLTTFPVPCRLICMARPTPLDLNHIDIEKLQGLKYAQRL